MYYIRAFQKKNDWCILYIFCLFSSLRGRVFVVRIRNKNNFFFSTPVQYTSAENNTVMFSCLFSGVEMVVRDAQGGVSVYNVETNKHRILLTSSSFVSANLLRYRREHTFFFDD